MASFAPLIKRPVAKSGAPSAAQPQAGGAFQGPFPHRVPPLSDIGRTFGVRVHADQRAAASARTFHADAFTTGHDIFFGRGRYNPSSSEGQRLLIHELAHVFQQQNAGPLSSPADLEREADRVAEAAMAGQRIEPRLSAPAGQPQYQATRNPFDDPKAWSNATEAAKAMQAYQMLPLAQRRAAVAASYKADLVRVLQRLSATDQVKTFVDPLREIARLVEELETRASARMTDDQIAGEEAKFLARQAAEAARAAADAEAKRKGTKPVPPTRAEIEQARKDAVNATSIQKSTTTWWGSLSASDKANWTARGNAAIAAVVKHAALKHPELRITASDFKLDFPGVEGRGATVVAAGKPAQVGRAFVISVELNPAYVMDVVVHELFGHPEFGVYGEEYHLALYDLAATKLPGYVKPAAGSIERRTELDAYGYQETEIYAVLRSMSYRTAPTAADASKVPNLDTQALVNYHVGLIKKQWAPTLVVPILRGLRKRFVIDPRISGAALHVLDRAVETAFDAATRKAVAAP